MIQAQVYKVENKVYICKSDLTKEKFLARSKGELFSHSTAPVVGDLVLALQDARDKTQYRIETILERKNELYQYKQRERKRRVFASNVDLVVIVISAELPKYKRSFLERYLLRTALWKLPAIVILNKMDLLKADSKVQILSDIDYFQKALNLPFFQLSAISAEFESLDPQNTLLKGSRELNETLKNKLCVFLGQSGVGKSSILSYLSSGQYLPTVRSLGKANKGMHTTSACEIFNYQSWSLMDTPGIRALSIEDIPEEELLDCFPDLVAFKKPCRFSNCLHLEKTLGCGFFEGQKEIPAHILERLTAYHGYLNEIKSAN